MVLRVFHPNEFFGFRGYKTMLADTLRFVQKAEAGGVDVKLIVWEGRFHVFHMFPFFAETAEAVTQIADFVQAQILQ